MISVIHVSAPCRLHFGLFGIGQSGERQFGGVGVMVEPPSLELRIRPAARFAAVGPLANRAAEFARRAAARWKLTADLPCQIDIRSAPENHVGLGVGTQLGLAIAAGLTRFLAMPAPPANELARAVGRGARSAVGTYGFRYGGLIVDAGKEDRESIGCLETRFPVPQQWRFLLIRTTAKMGLSGDQESSAFDSLPTVPRGIGKELRQLVREHMLPAIRSARCDQFGESVYQFGRLSGSIFAHAQNGPFASAQIETLVESIRGFGIPGVGQSSWGPTVFAITPGQAEADRLCEWLCRREPGCAVEVSRPNNTGARIDTLPQ